MIAILAMRESITCPRRLLGGRHHRQLSALYDDAALTVDDDVVRGWIRITPPEQRNGLIAVIESLGLEPEPYADELESAEGWDEEFEGPPDSGM